MTQYVNLLEYDQLPGFQSMFLDPPTPYMLSEARYGYKRSELIGLNTTAPIHAQDTKRSRMNLVQHPLLRKRVMIMSRPKTMFVSDLS